MTRRRLDDVRRLLVARRLDALVVSHLPQVRYLCGFSGSNGLLIVGRRTDLFATDGRYAEQVKHEVTGPRVVIGAGPLVDIAAPRLSLRRGARIGFDPEQTTVAGMRRMRSAFPRASFQPVPGILEPLIAVKDEDEIAATRVAIAISERVWNEVLPMIVPGVRESEIAARITYLHRLHGADGDGFEPIVASGPRGALPHARASERRVRRGELVTIDFGCRWKGYHSDITRTVSIGRPTPRLRHMYQAVLEAQLAALMLVRAGIDARAVDAEARRVLRAHRLLPHFRHSLGHGLGLQIHEAPRLAPTSSDVLRRWPDRHGGTRRLRARGRRCAHRGRRGRPTARARPSDLAAERAVDPLIPGLRWPTTSAAFSSSPITSRRSD
jgi:Xaa-Pro aminopeptidase